MSSSRHATRTAAASLLSIGAVAAVWGVGIERHLFTLRRDTFPVLPAGSAPVKVLHLSDFHITPWQRRKARWIRELAKHNPDLVVLTGDLMGHVHAHAILRYALAPFTGTAGVYVHGSNDYYGPILKNPLKYLRAPSRLSTRTPDIDTRQLERFLEDTLGFTGLNNAATLTTVQGTPLRFAGLGDPHIRYDRPDVLREAVSALPTLPSPSTTIGVVHAPYREALDALLEYKPAVMFAGHTHGGQVRVPGVGALTSNSDLPPFQARGTSVWHGPETASLLHVSAGLGHSLYSPVRFACRPEASLITLTAPKALQSAQC